MTLSEFKRFANENNIVPVSAEIYSKMISDSVMLIKYKEVLQEIRKEIDGIRYADWMIDASSYAVVDTVLEVIDKHIAEELG